MIEIKNLRRELIRAILVILLIVLIITLVAEMDRVRRLIWGVEEGVSYLNRDLDGYLRSEVRKVVLSTSEQIASYPVSADLNRETGELKADQSGEIVAITETVDKIMEASEDSQVEPVVYKLEPYLTIDQLKRVDTELNSYSTVVTGGPGRVANIKRATRLINNRLVLAGEEFSFNQIVGPRTEERGFKEAPELEEGELISGIGGGICQVSSTLYNAASPEGLTVLERHSHSQDVSYVPDGQDATVAWEILDFRFRNDFSTPIIVKAYVSGGKLTVTILGVEEGESS